MNNELDKELRKMLEDISDTYDDFVNGIAPFCKTDEERLKVIDYIKAKNNATTSDVIDFYYDEIYLKRKETQ